MTTPAYAADGQATRYGRTVRRFAFAFLASASAPLIFAAGCGDQTVTPTQTPPNPDAGDTDAADGGSDLTIGVPNKFVFRGMVITPDDAIDGEVFVVDEMIVCVEKGRKCSESKDATGATIIETHGVIAPGLIDTHNHILFDIFDNDDWGPEKAYENHSDWPKEARYSAMLDVKQCLEDASQGKPTWCPAKYDGQGNLKCEMNKWGELKGMIAGTTSIVGLPGNSVACFGSLSRSIDGPNNDLKNGDLVQTSSLFPPAPASADGVCNNVTAMKTSAYLIHVGEGTNEKARAEFDILGSVTTTDNCLYAPSTVITHGTAFTAAEFAKMGQTGMKLTWSPASNVALYGVTTNIPLALDNNVMVTLAPDWSMGGSQNMLDEMRFANAWDDKNWGDRLSTKDIVTMSTKNAAIALGLDDKIGTIKVGLFADLFVVKGDPKAPYDAVVAATPATVRAVMVGGKILFGDESLQRASPATPCEKIELCGAKKFVCVAETDQANKLNQTYEQIKDILETGMTDMDQASSTDPWSFAPLAPVYRCP
ncbi:MAG: S-adenosylhomocysteine deaminase [Myxococcaceae bacterium]|nr:S-adenosylhomocysteine deaminase [Myxococcaceae bacterium]